MCVCGTQKIFIQPIAQKFWEKILLYFRTDPRCQWQRIFEIVIRIECLVVEKGDSLCLWMKLKQDIVTFVEPKLRATKWWF